jgi:YebC/PmpR family DNA-binding regulatory protein
VAPKAEAGSAATRTAKSVAAASRIPWETHYPAQGFGPSLVDLEAVAGHSKWAQIKRKKGATDAKRGNLFTKLARAIQVAAREGGGDPAGNSALANAIQKAKEARMPKENIERAIAKGTGADSSGEQIDEVLYEGYGPGGVAILVEALTDNRNRTGSEVRHAFSKAGGSLGEPGSVAWNFEKKGLVLVDADRYSEDDLMPAIDAGAEDVREEDGKWTVICEPADLSAVREALEAAGVEVESATIATEPKSTIELKGHDAERLLKLLDALDEQDDVDEVFANFDIPEQVLEELAA